MASSCRTVIGMLERVFASNSEACTCLRIETKCEDSFSAASGERRGAHRLDSDSLLEEPSIYVRIIAITYDLQ